MNRVLNSIAWPLFYFICTFLVAGFWARIGVDVHHDGIMLKPALDVSHGLRLFGDTFSQYGALTTLIQAAAIAVFGEKLIVIRMTTAFFYALSSVLLWYIWKQVLPQALVFVAYVLWLALAGFLVMTFLPWSSVFALFFQLAVIGTLITWHKKDRNHSGYLVASGFLIGCAFLCRQPVGVTLLAAVVGWLFLFRQKEALVSKNFLKQFLALSFGFLMISALFLSWLILTESLTDWWIQSIKWPKVWASKSLGGSLLDNVKAIYFVVFETVPMIYRVLPIITIIYAIKLIVDFHLRKRRNLDVYVTSLVAIVAIGSWHQYYPIACPRHTWWAAAPMFGVFVCFSWHSTRLAPNWLRTLILGTIVYFAFADVGTKNFHIAKARYESLNGLVTIENPRVLWGMKETPAAAANFAKIAESLEGAQAGTSPAPIYMGHSALYATLIPHYKNYHKLTVLWDGLPELYSRENIMVLEHMLSEGHTPVLIEGEVLPFFQDRYTRKEIFEPNGEYQGRISLYVPKERGTTF